MIRRRITALAADARGGVLVEFALVAPTVIFLIVGMLQTGMLFYANTSMRSALGEGARFAQLYRAPTGTWSGPTAAQICERVTSRIDSMNNAQITSLTLTRAVNGTANALTLAINYRVNLDFILFQRAPVLTSTRRVYLRTQPNFASYTCP